MPSSFGRQNVSFFFRNRSKGEKFISSSIKKTMLYAVKVSMSDDFHWSYDFIAKLLKKNNNVINDIFMNLPDEKFLKILSDMGKFTGFSWLRVIINEWTDFCALGNVSCTHFVVFSGIS